MSDTTDSPSPQPEADIDKRPEAILGRPEIPSEDVPVVIDVSHVQMIFNMASEELGSLKEYFIKIARHELFFKEFHALEDITFQVRRGEAFGLVGTNGSGKSTMLKIIAGVLEPSKGSVRVDGSIAPLIELGAGFDMELTAKENIYLNGSLLGYSKAFIDEKFDDIVDFAELRDFMDMPLKNYSSGMVARIAFAIATITVPDVLIVRPRMLDRARPPADAGADRRGLRRVQGTGGVAWENPRPGASTSPSWSPPTTPSASSTRR